MNTRRTIGQWGGGAVAGDNQVLPEALAEGVATLVNPTGLTDADVQASLAQMEHAITI